MKKLAGVLILVGTMMSAQAFAEVCKDAKGQPLKGQALKDCMSKNIKAMDAQKVAEQKKFDAQYYNSRDMTKVNKLGAEGRAKREVWLAAEKKKEAEAKAKAQKLFDDQHYKSTNLADVQKLSKEGAARRKVWLDQQKVLKH